jgi:hypothetical protein
MPVSHPESIHSYRRSIPETPVGAVSVVEPPALRRPVSYTLRKPSLSPDVRFVDTPSGSLRSILGRLVISVLGQLNVRRQLPRTLRRVFEPDAPRTTVEFVKQADGRMRLRAPADRPDPWVRALRLLLRVPAEELERFATDLDVANNLEGEDLWGPPVSNDDLRSAMLWHLREGFRRRAEVVRSSWGVAQTAEALQTDEDAVRTMIEAGDVCALLDARGEFRIPAWQFDYRQPTGLVQGLGRLLAVFPGDVVNLSLWVARPNVDLDDATPQDSLHRGELDRVLAAARSIRSDAW